MNASAFQDVSQFLRIHCILCGCISSLACNRLFTLLHRIQWLKEMPSKVAASQLAKKTKRCLISCALHFTYYYTVHPRMLFMCQTLCTFSIVDGYEVVIILLLLLLYMYGGLFFKGKCMYNNAIIMLLVRNFFIMLKQVP